MIVLDASVVVELLATGRWPMLSNAASLGATTPRSFRT